MITIIIYVIPLQFNRYLCIDKTSGRRHVN